MACKTVTAFKAACSEHGVAGFSRTTLAELPAAKERAMLALAQKSAPKVEDAPKAAAAAVNGASAVAAIIMACETVTAFKAACKEHKIAGFSNTVKAELPEAKKRAVNMLLVDDSGDDDREEVEVTERGGDTVSVVLTRNEVEQLRALVERLL